MLGQIAVALAKQIAGKRRPPGRPPLAPARQQSGNPIARTLANVINDPEAFRRLSYLLRGEQPPAASQASGPAGASPSQPQDATTGFGRLVAALAMGAQPFAAPEPADERPAEPEPQLPYPELIQRFNKAVGQYSAVPKAAAQDPATKRELRRVAAQVRRRSEIGSTTRIAARDAAIVARPTAAERQQWAASRPTSRQSPPRQRAQGREQGGWGFMDGLQSVLDVIGVFDPTPVTDWTNAGISLTRAAVDPERRGEHLLYAGVSAVSGAAPYVGDAAKVLKVPRAAVNTARTTKRAARAAGSTKAGKRVRSFGERVTDTATGFFFGPTARQRRAASRLRGDGAPAVGGGSGGGGGGRGPRAATGGSSPDDRGGPFKRFRTWASSIGSPRAERSRDEAKGREKAGKALDSFGDRLKESGGALVKLGAAGIAAFESLRLFNTGVISYNRDLAQFNGRLAAAYGQYRADEIRRTIRSGRAVEEPLSGLIEGQSRLADIRQQFTDPLKKMGLSLQEGLTNGAATILEAGDRFTGASKALERAANVFSAAMKLDLKEMQRAFWGEVTESDSDTVFREFLRDVADGKFDGKAPKFDDRMPAKPDRGPGFGRWTPLR